MPINAIIDMNMSGKEKLVPRIRNPIAIGTTIAAQLEMKLNTPPVSPISLSGAMVDITDQLIEANPHPKKEQAIKESATEERSVKFARHSVLASRSPVMIGSLRATVRLWPLRRSQSESIPPDRTPTKAARKGKAAINPAFTRAICLKRTR